jgi:hypothetical protein
VHQETPVRRRYTVGLVAATSILLVGCGSSVPEGAVDAEWQAAPEGDPDHDPVMPVGPGGDLEMEAGEFFFEITGGTPVTGEIEVTGTNVGGSFHDIHFAGAAEGSEIIEMDPGETETGTVLLFPGDVVFWCDVPGHREAGMEGTVTVFATEEEAEEAAAEGELPGDEAGDADGEAGDAGGEGGDAGGDEGEDLDAVDPAG